jgi:TolB-like protein/DNA-binding SARP family transcriptional activator/Flp pilus assembly protein TadD
LPILRLKLLGQVECRTADGAQLTLSTRKSEVLLAYLALAPGIRHPRERLINLLWSDRSEDQARNSLRQALSAIKKSLGSTNSKLMEVERTTVRLNPKLVQVDTLDFDHHAAQTDIDNLASAAALYQGEFLEGIVIRDAASQEWLSNERDRFKRQIVEVLSGLSHLHLTSGQHKQAIESAEQLVIHDPLHEHGWRILMRAYHQKGDRNHALLTYKRCSQVLVKELGIEPETETTALRDSIISDNLGDTKVTPTVAISSEVVTKNSVTDSDDKEHSILVLPFENLSDDSDQQYFSDGLTEGIIMGLSLFPALIVHSRHSSFAAAEKNLSIEQISREFRSLYVVEGSVRKTNDQVRITAQLVNTQSGEQIWGKRFDSKFDEVLSLEDQITQSIVAIVKGKIDSTDQQLAYRKPAKDMQSYDLLMRGTYHSFRFNPQDIRIATDLIRRCLDLDPGNAEAHEKMYRCYLANWLAGWTEPRAEASSNMGFHIRKALELKIDDSGVQSSYAEYLAFIGEFEQAEIHANRSLELNPNDTESLARASGVQASLGNIQASLDLVDACQRLDPFHPLITWISGIAYYRGKKYQEALEAFKKSTHPAEEIDGWITACYERLGDHKNATKHLTLYLEAARINMAKFPQSLDGWKEIWHDTAAYRHEDGIDYPFDALCDAGLKQFVEEDTTDDPTSELHSIAVLPFDNLSGDPEQEYFSDGITESIILNLTLFPELQVKSRNSSFAFKQQIKSLGEISKELAVDYIVEGSIRKAGDHIKITVQLIEAASGNQIWGNRYESSSDKLFDLEEQLSRQIAATVTGRIESDLESTAIAKSAADKQSYDLLLAGRYHANKFTRQDMVTAITYLEQCLTQDPHNVQAHALLYLCHSVNWMEYWSKDYKESFRLAGKHSHKAFALDPDNPFAQWAHAEYLIFSREYEKAEHLINKALSANPYNPYLLATKSFNLIMIGEYKSALKIAETSFQLDPFNSWTSWMLAEAQLLSDQPQAAIDTMLNSKTSPSFFYALLAIAYLRVSELEKSREVVQKLIHTARESMLSMPGNRDEWVEYWLRFSPYEDISIGEQLIDELIQIGLCDDVPIAAEIDNNQLPTIVVLPFDNLSGDSQQEYFSDGITESVILSLSSIHELTVKSRHTSFAYKHSTKSANEIGTELDAQYIVEGSVRNSTDKIRITVQLVETATSNQIWGKRYDAASDQLFELEEELCQAIASTIFGRIGRQVKLSKYQKPAKDLKAYDYLMRGWYHAERLNVKDNAIAMEQFQKCLEIDPSNADAHLAITAVSSVQLFENWTADRAKTVAFARQHINKALELEPDNAMAHAFKSEHLHIRREFERALYHAERSIELNPTLVDGPAMKAFILATMRQYQDVVKLTERCIELDPYHPYIGWNAGEVFRIVGEYDRAIKAFRTVSHPPPNLVGQLAACLVELGKVDQARSEMKTYHAMAREQMPVYPASKDQWRQLWYDASTCQFEEDFEKLFDALLKAGLCDEIEDRTDEKPSIVVLPFENLGGNPEQEYFSNGITESVILCLSAFNDLDVKSRHSSFIYKDSHKSLSEIGEKLGIQYVIEGSVRLSSSKIRITAQLVEAASGNQVWGKRYDTDLDQIFELEEELSQTIAGTIYGRIGKQIKQAKYQKPAKNQKAYDYLMRAWYHGEKMNPVDGAIMLEQIQKCLEIDPENADAQVSAAANCSMSMYENWVVEPAKSLDQAYQHIERAIELDPGNALGHAFMAEVLQLKRDFDRSLYHADKAIELNPMLPDGLAMKAYLLAGRHEFDEAFQLAERSIELDPDHPYTAWNVGQVFFIAGDYDRALKAFRSIPNLPTSLHAEIAACLVNLGNTEQARTEMKVYLDLARSQMANYPASPAQWRQLWNDIYPCQIEEDFEALFDALLQAGLCDEIEDQTEDMPSIAVLPFENMSGDPEQEYFSDGISASLILGLGLFKGLNVKSQNSSFAFKDSKLSSTKIANELNADFLIEGSIRKSGSKVRLSVQLVESASDSQIWGKQYDAELEDILELEQELSQTVAATISGRIGHKLQQSASRKPAKNLHSYDYLLRGLYHLGMFTARDLKLARQLIEQCLEIDPDNATAHTNLGMIHFVDLIENWASDRHQSIEAAQQHIKRSLELDPESALVHAYAADFLNYIRDFDQSEFHADKAIELNPNASEGYAAKADVLGFTRRVDEAIQYADKCLQLDPHSVGAGWCAGDVYRIAGLYPKAIKTFRSITHIPASLHALIATCFVAMESPEEAHKEMLLYKKLAQQEMPHYPRNETEWRKIWRDNMLYQYEEDFDAFFPLLLAAGLCDETEDQTDDTPSIAVLPFENMSGDPEQEYFSDGITSDIIATLSRFRGMQVIARHSTLVYKDRKASIDEIAAEQQVRYILEGSIRKSGKRIRVNAELIDSHSGENCWSESYDRNLDDIFAVQDEITLNIAVEMKVLLTDGDRAREQSAGTKSVKAWELCTRAAELQDSYIRENINQAHDLVKKSLEIDPDFSYAWTILGWLHWQEAFLNWVDSIDDALDEAEEATQKALELTPLSADAWILMGAIWQLRGEIEQAVAACEKAVSIAPGNAEVQMIAAWNRIFAGETEKALPLYQNAIRLAPIYPPWFSGIEGYLHEKEGRIQEAIAAYRHGIEIEPESPLQRVYLIDALLKTNQIDEARKVADEIRALDSDFKVSGIIRGNSPDPVECARFKSNMEKMGFLE